MSQPERIQPEPIPITAQVSAGQILSSRRQSWDVSVEDIAANLNLGVETIEAIEQDAYDRLPGSTFVKGYIRSYAKLLELDAEKVLETLDLEPEKVLEIPTLKSSIKGRGKTATRPQPKSGGGFFKLILSIALLGAVAYGSVHLMQKNGYSSLSELFQLPGAGSTQDATGLPLSSGENESADGKKSALIRIE
ncbi:MAG: helix-turn-helix domain-containing protein [Pseudomonadota bacterium]